MAVKDLIGQYEAQSPSPPPSARRTSFGDLPPPSRARFIHPLLQPPSANANPQPSSSSQPSAVPAQRKRRESAPPVSAGISNITRAATPQKDDVSSLKQASVRESRRKSLPAPEPSMLKSAVTRRSSAAPTEKGTLPRSTLVKSMMTPIPAPEPGSPRPSSSTTFVNDPALSVPSRSRPQLRPNIYPPSIHSISTISPSSIASSSTKFSEPLHNLPEGQLIPLRPLTRSALVPLAPSIPTSPYSTVVSSNRTIHHISKPRFAPHVPIPAKKVFARNAIPLSLPDLDAHLSTIPGPAFTPFPGPKPSKGKARVTEAVFPPLELLKDQKIDDLLYNTTVAPVWRDRNTILGAVSGAVLGFIGSSAIANYYSLQGIYDTIQIFALLLSSIVPRNGRDQVDYWRNLFLVTIPNILALNLSSTLTQSLIFLVVFMVISASLLYYFHGATVAYSPNVVREGLQSQDRGGGWSLILVTTVLTILYLPLSTIAVHALVWSSDFWVVPNPYATNATFPPPPLGPSIDWRDPLDFCYTTTMNKSELNWAPIIVILSAITFVSMTIWFPIRLMQAIKVSLPKVDPYTELGKRRSEVEMENEYRRLLDRDRNPFSFLYHDFKRAWGGYKAIYLWAKLSALLIIAFIDPDNCVFRWLPREQIGIIRQVILVLSMLVWFLLQTFIAPFVDPVNNASEWTSRANYLTTSAVGLGVALNIPGKAILEGPVLYIIYIVTYGLSIYFTVLDSSLAHRIIKRISRRIDFSIDIFSPHLDITPYSPHVRRRIWQETISTLLLTAEDCRIPAKQKMEFAYSRDSQWPPYLLDFQGSPGERHAENLKILREVGWLAYARGISLTTGPEAGRLEKVESVIQKYFIGPDCFWESKFSGVATPSGRGKFFGNAWWTPFPPSLTIRYDNGHVAVIQKLEDFEDYVAQNEAWDVRKRRSIRLALRSLDGQIVKWPYTHVELVGERTPWPRSSQYKIQSTVHYESCVFEIKRKGWLSYYDLQLGSGFEVQLTYDRRVKRDGDVIELDDDFDLTPGLAQFLLLNRDLIDHRSAYFEQLITSYRKEFRTEFTKKAKTLTYRFLADVYNHPARPEEIAKIVERQEPDLRVRDVLLSREDAFLAASERMELVTSSDVATWWYLFWDDFWRRNHDTISALPKYATDFSPHYPTSIAYRPLPRPALEGFLVQRGMFSTKPRWFDFIHTGFLNKLYFQLNQIVFHGTERKIFVHVGNKSLEMDLERLDLGSDLRGTSTLGDGGGTDHDDGSIRFRPAYRWEGIYSDPIRGGKGRERKRWTGKLGVWFGVTPLVRTKMRTNGISLDVVIQGGKYVMVEQLGRHEHEHEHGTGKPLRTME